MGYPVKATPKATPRARGQEERAEALTGLRNDEAPEKLAVTRGDLAKLGNIKLLSNKVSAAPTLEQHNALIEDVRQIASLLNSMGAKFSGF